MAFTEPTVTTLMMAQKHFLGNLITQGHPKRYEISKVRSEVLLRP